ncbi:MAG: hypothetical protein PsegKO_15410 [Pseudohongiellaceae bacterium]|jgi:chorismate mutase
MDPESVPAELLEARNKIDQIDSQIIKLLAARFEYTHRIGTLKAAHSLEALDSNREAEKLAEIRALCVENGLNPELVSDLFTQIMEEVVRNHNRLRDKQGTG